MIRDSWGFLLLAAAGAVAWTTVVWTMHRSAAALRPPCRRCAGGFHRNDREGKIDSRGDRHWICGWDGELRIEECTNTSTPISCSCHHCKKVPA